MDFLFEVGLEEVPARMLAGAQAELLKRTVALLERERLVTGELIAQSYSTPRRLAVLVQDVAERQQDLSEEVVGPAVRIAYKDGQPGPAAIAFAKKSGVDVSALKIVAMPKGEYIAATSVKPGRSASEVLAEGMPKELAGIYWAKNMYWRAGKPERFVRPVRWMVALLGDAVVPVSFGGYTAGRETYGHRVLLGAKSIRVESPALYVEQLKAAFVMADVEVRRHTIRKALDHACRTLPDTRWREDHALVDKMTHMTEWPSVIAGGFEAEFLALPQEVLVTVMRDHQNYFAVESRDGKLAPYFLAVLNTVSDDAGQAIIRHGNERVLRARFNDARFFWEFDQRVLLEDRVALLENVTFQKDLGSYAAKSARVAQVAEALGGLVAERGVTLDIAALASAARLAKADLTSELVKEFTELQGEVGGLYARAQGISAVAADAIYDHYRPVSMEDRIPRTVEGQVLAIADKIDTIAGMFGLGMEPTGSKDPFALRRAANGIVKILAEGDLSLTVHDAIAAAKTSSDLVARLQNFFVERIEFYLREAQGQAYDVVKAVLAAGSVDLRDIVARARAVSQVRGGDDFAAISGAFKRMKNIVAQASQSGPVEYGSLHEEVLEIAPAQRALSEAADAAVVQVQSLAEQREYVQALTEISRLRPAVDAFFEQVMVLDPNPLVREARVRLLAALVANFSTIADFSEIVTSGQESNNSKS